MFAYIIMSERELGQQTRLNTLDWVNYDPHLSQFKHHIIMHRVHIPQLQFNDFASNLYRAFRPSLTPSAIYIIQIVETYDSFLYDVAVGFRRDAEAIAVYEKNRNIYLAGRDVEVSLAEAFKTYLDAKQMNSSGRKSDRRKKSYSHSDYSSSGPRRRRKGSSRSRRSRSRSSSYSSSSRSRSRSKSRSRSPSISMRSQRKDFKGTFCIPLLPYQWNREYLQSKICQQLKCYRSDISVDQKRGEFASMTMTVRSQSVYNDLLSGARLGEHSLLLIRAEQMDKLGLKAELKKYQFKAHRVEQAPLEFAFDELSKFLLNFKEFHLKVVMITCLESYFLVTTQTRITTVLKFLKLNGWRFEPTSFALRLNPSLQDRWFQYLKNNSY